MARWELLTPETAREIWDQNLFRFTDFSPFQMYAWGEYNRALNWKPLYLAARNENDEVVALMLGLLRRYPFGTGLLWCAGGPVGDVKTLDRSLQQTLLKTTNLKRLYCRFRCDRERSIGEALALNQQSWMRSWFMQYSNWTMELDLRPDEAQMLSNCSRNWRRNLLRAQKNNLQIRLWADPDIDEIIEVYAEMQARKNLPQLISRQQLEALFERVGSNFICYRADDEDGKVVALRGCLIAGGRALDYLAASTERGRDLRASYVVFWKLLQECSRRGAQFYDLSGIDPHENPGVYSFKKETGARHVELLGEWDWASSNWLRCLGNWAIWQRHRLKAKG